MKRIIPLLAVLAMATQAIQTSAQPPERKRGFNERPQRGADGQNRRGMGEQGRRPGGADAGGPMNFDPSKIAARMMGQFDKDGDEKLDQSELLALLTSMQNRRGMGPGAGNDSNRDGMQRGKGRRPGEGARPGADRANKKRRPQNDNDTAEPGGTAPQRPTAE